MPTPPQLRRRLTTTDGVVIGVGSMVGAGIFTAFAPAAASAGSLLWLALALAAVVALCNATSSAQLAAQYPTSGGTYVYGRERLGPWWGFVAGWGFVIGKTASCAAMAMTFAAYTVPHAWQKPVACLAVIALAAVNYRGVTRTAGLTRLIVGIVLACLTVAVVALLASPPAASAAQVAPEGSWHGVLQGSAILFFAFAGYARIATMGEEVVDPRRTIPRAILTAFVIVVAVYAVMAFALVRSVGIPAMASGAAPARDAATAVNASAWVLAAIVVGASLATLGALLGLVAGVGRTALAMAREGDLPRGLAAVHVRYAVPHVAEVTLACVVCGLIVVTDLRGAIGFSSFGVLTYYAVANLAALTQGSEHRLYPRALAVAGLCGCVALALAVPTSSLAVGLVVLVVGVVGRAVHTRRGSQGSQSSQGSRASAG